MNHSISFSCLLLILLIIFLCINHTSQSVTYSYNDSRINYYGRYYTDESGLRFGWSCFTIEFCFTGGSRVWWLGKDHFGHYKIILNNKTETSLIPKKKIKSIIYQSNQVNASINCIKIVKITEDHYGPLGTHTDALFQGLQIQGNPPNLVFPQNNYKYKLQFIGDSWTSAFGSTGKNPYCFLRLRQHQSCLSSWAVQLANMLGAQYRMVAVSGAGVAKNAFGIVDPTMPISYTKTTANSKPFSYHYQDKYNPDAIIIYLGQNDFSALTNPTQKQFTMAYQKMMNSAVKMQVQNLGRKVKIIGICYLGDEPPQICEYIKSAIKSFNYAYDLVYYVEVPARVFAKGDFACVGHPNEEGYRKLADAIYPKVKQILYN